MAYDDHLLCPQCSMCTLTTLNGQTQLALPLSGCNVGKCYCVTLLKVTEAEEGEERNYSI